MNVKKIEEVLSNWTTLNKYLTGKGVHHIHEIEQLLKHETEHQKRKTFLERLHAKFWKLKVQKDRSTLIGDTR